MILLGTILEKDVPEVLTNEGWKKMESVKWKDLKRYGLSGQTNHGINEKGESLDGQLMPDYVLEHWHRLKA